MKTTLTTTAGSRKMVQKGDWVSFDGIDYIITKIEDETSFSIKRVCWYHRLWKWLKSDF